MDQETSSKSISLQVYEIMQMIFAKQAQMRKHPVDYGDGQKFYIGEIHVIEYIGNNPGCNIKEIADYSSVSAAAASRAVTKLEQKGLVQKIKGEVDKRDVRICLTDGGKRAYDAHTVYHTHLKNEYMDLVLAMTPEEQETIFRFLTCYDRDMQKYI